MRSAPLALGLLLVVSGCDDSISRQDADVVDDSVVDALDQAVQSAACGESGQATELVPIPRDVRAVEGCFRLTPSTAIVAPESALGIAEQLASVLRPSTGFSLEVRDAVSAAGDLRLVLRSDLGLGPEGYTLSVRADGVVIEAETGAGLFYGCQTLRLLLPHEIEAEARVDGVDWLVGAVEIRDWPRFEWRGSMLDIARHYFGPDHIREYIDWLALHKLNRLHLHLTDDQGWRLEIRAWPDLALIGGATEVGGGEGGYLTQDEYSALVDYAAERFVTIVPEIDMPGHTNAALASYGALNEDGEPTEPYTGQRVGFSSLWLDGEITREFVADVLAEVAGLTPGAWIHIGGDESNATDPDDYAAFIGWVQTTLSGHDKVMIGWDEIADVELQPGFFGQYWLDVSRAAQVASAGGRLISSPAQHAYLDMKYDLSTPVGHFWAGLIDTQVAYEWDPVPDGVDESAVVGLEAPLWTETTETWDDVELLVFPRLAGHAEMAWSAAADLDWEDYRVRLAAHGSRLEALGIGFYRSPLVEWQTGSAATVSTP